MIIVLITTIRTRPLLILHIVTMQINQTLKPLIFALSSAFAFAAASSTYAQNSSQGDVVQLGTVVVSATGSEQLVEDAPASITVVSREDLEKKAYGDVTAMLMDVPGVNITGGGSYSDISIRGMSSGYTMLLVDGKRQNSRETRPNSDNSGIEQGWLPPLQAIERIEVIRGPMSSLYGSDAMGGVINIITRKVPDEWTGSIRNELTLQEDSDSGNIYSGNLYLGGPIIKDKLGVQIFGQKYYRQEDKILSGFANQDKTAGAVRFAFTPNEDHDITAEFSRSIQERNTTPGKSIAETDNRGRPNSASNTTYYQSRYSLGHVGRWGDVTSDTYVQHTKTDNPTRDMFLKNTEFDTKWTAPLGSHLFTAGFHYQKENLTDSGNRLGKAINKLSRYQWALFAEDEWWLTDSFALTGGLRMTKDENYGSHWTPRLYGVWHMTDNLTLKGGVSTGFKAPGLRHAVADWGQGTGGGRSNGVIIGNPDLKPEKSISQEIALLWDNHAGFNAGLTLFNTQFKDKITEERVCQSNNGSCLHGGERFDFISTRFNVDKAVMRGVEFTTSWQALDNLRLSANYTYTSSKQKSGPFVGRPLNKNPRHMINATVEWDPMEDLGLWSRVNFRGKTTEYLSRTSMADGTASYAFFDVGLNYKVNKNVSVGLSAYNILDKRVTNEDFGGTYDGRRYWLQLTANF